MVLSLFCALECTLQTSEIRMSGVGTPGIGGSNMQPQIRTTALRQKGVATIPIKGQSLYRSWTAEIKGSCRQKHFDVF